MESKLEKFIEVSRGKQIDLYHLNGITVNHFIDHVYSSIKKSKMVLIDITKEEFFGHVNHQFKVDFNVDDEFTVAHYPRGFTSKKAEKKWKDLIKEINEREVQIRPGSDD